MSDQSFEIRCPKCKAVLSLDSASAHNCTPAPRETTEADARTAVALDPATVNKMHVKDYHQLVQSYYVATEGPRVSGSGRLHAYLPFVILVIGLLVGGAVAFGYF